MQLCTIGFTQKSLRQFIELLRTSNVDGMVDIRLNNVSQLAGFAKRDDLAFVLETFGIGYVEEKRLAPTEDLLRTYQADRDWDRYEVAFRTLLAGRNPAGILDEIEARFERPCLLCAEPEPSRCHRRLVAEAFAALRPGLEVRHLVLERAKPGSRTHHSRRASSTRKGAKA